MLTNKFFDALRSARKPYHEIAWEAGITPNQLYKITSGVDRPKKNDPRITKLCEYLGLLTSEAFDETKE
jgi:hypothetical protein